MNLQAHKRNWPCGDEVKAKGFQQSKQRNAKQRKSDGRCQKLVGSQYLQKDGLRVVLLDTMLHSGCVAFREANENEGDEEVMSVKDMGAVLFKYMQ